MNLRMLHSMARVRQSKIGIFSQAIVKIGNTMYGSVELMGSGVKLSVARAVNIRRVAG